MLLKSSSTPVLGSLLSSFAESPGNSHHHSDLHNATPKQQTPTSAAPAAFRHHHNKLSCNSYGHHQGLTSSLCNSSPISPSISDYSPSTKFSSMNGFRRAQSESNLEALARSSSIENVDEFTLSSLPKKFPPPRRPNFSTLEAIPSFSFHNSRHDRREDEESDDDWDYEEEEADDEEIDSGDIDRYPGAEMKFGYDHGNGRNMVLENGREEMHLARGLGVADISLINGGGIGGGDGGGRNYRPVSYGKDGGDSHGLGVEEHYKKMLNEDPSNSLLMRNYAQFLYQTKRDLKEAEEYYSRAILADPTDGEILSQYAILIWELHRDKDRATNYFERAIQASVEDSHVHAAYARFLWDVEEDDEDDKEKYRATELLPLTHEGVVA